ncbi:MAG: FMN-binding negative transcriptional regulator [Acidiferrobacterales bacterium]|nr:FMN-binding negative transcriptional regulator [Acidiferrobacterales bacterium]
MYIPSHFAIDDKEIMLQLAKDHNFGILVSVIDEFPYASHLPFDIREVDNQVWLYGHVAKANPHWHYFDQSIALAIFEGPHGYISPTWYQEQGVPTWNYAVVHMRGEMEAMTEREPTRDVVEDLSELHERENPEPWIPDYPDAMLDAIVSFRMRVTEMKGKFKLSQNRKEVDKTSVLKQLSHPFGQQAKEHHEALATLMHKHNSTNE